MKLTEVSTRSGQVEFLDPERSADRAAWMNLWAGWPHREVMAHPDYVRLSARPVDRVVAATVRTPQGGILYPVILRPLAAEPWGLRAGRACDMTTAYGYGGPFGWNVTEQETVDFWARFDAWAVGEGSITSFARLSLFPETLLPFNGETQTRATNIVRRLDLPEEEIWADYSYKVRRNVRHAQELGVSVEQDPTGKRLDSFLDIYTARMKHLGASSDYLFPRRYFESIVHDLPGSFSFYHALFEEKVISSELVLFSKDRAYSFLLGSLEEAFKLRATDLLKHEIFLRCRAAGMKSMVLGGGYRGEDGVFVFKKSFAPGGGVDFRIGKRVYDAGLSAQLEEDRRRYERALGNDWHPAPDFFPVYRA